MTGVVVAGAGQAGLQVAVSLREAGYREPITLVGAEAHLPYQRPPLSKGFVTGKVALEGLWLRNEAFFGTHDITVVLGARIVGVDRTRNVATDDRGAEYTFAHLVLATGSEPRRLSGVPEHLSGVHTLRTVDDSLLLRQELERARDVVVVGGGFVGLEVAATAARLGRTVTVVEATTHLMGRVVSPELSEFFRARHTDRGIHVLVETGVEAVEHSGGRVTGVRLAGGERLAADLVVVGIGASPRVELANQLGLKVDRGIVVDRHARTSDPQVLAVGDCAQHADLGGRSVLLESVQNAIDQARAAAATIVGDEAPYDAVPWFWSDQGDAKLQMAGLRHDFDRVVVRGSLEGGAFSLLYFDGDTFVAVESVNRPADHVAARRILTAGARLDPEAAKDVSTPLLRCSDL